MPPRADLTALHLQVLAFLLLHPQAQGMEVSEATGTKSGTLYPLLRQLAERGFLLAEVQAFGHGKTTYTVTGGGHRAFAKAATALVEALAPALELEPPRPPALLSPAGEVPVKAAPPAEGENKNIVLDALF